MLKVALNTIKSKPNQNKGRVLIRCIIKNQTDELLPVKHNIKINKVKAELVMTEKNFQEMVPSGNKNNNIYKANVETTACLTGNNSINTNTINTTINMQNKSRII